MSFLEVRKLGKLFPGVRALHEVDLTLNKGEVLALIGENGAGKSTLMKILAGVQLANTGEIHIDGKLVQFQSVKHALEHGVALIHQELNLSSNLGLAANIFLGRERNTYGFIKESEIHHDAGKHLERVGLEIPTDTLVGTLPIGKQQLVEIAKALSCNARVLIMDEPTSSLSQNETEYLFKVIKDLSASGVSIIYISHRLSEVKELADRVVALRDGENAGELSKEDVTHDAMARLMVGRDLSEQPAREEFETGETLLEVLNLRTPQNPSHSLNFSLQAGEIVGLAGLVGAGRTELLQTIFGVSPAVAGAVKLGQEPPFAPKSTREAIAAGMALAPEDRKQHGLILPMGLLENVSLASLNRDHRNGLLNFSAEKRIAVEAVEKLHIKTPNLEQMVQFLSGGNQQKVVLGKWLALNPKLLLLDEPTRGIDVGAKQEIYRLIEQLAGEGMGILFVSSDMEEVLRMSDRILVMHEGRLSGELLRDQFSEEHIMQLATGIPLAA